MPMEDPMAQYQQYLRQKNFDPQYDSSFSNVGDQPSTDTFDPQFKVDQGTTAVMDNSDAQQAVTSMENIGANNDTATQTFLQRQSQIQQQKLADAAAAAQAANNKKLQAQLDAQLRQIQQVTASGVTVPDLTTPNWNPSQATSDGTTNPGGSADTAERRNQQASATGGALAKYAAQFAGKVPYVDAGPNANPKTGWGCSEFVRYVMKQYGVNVEAYSPSIFGDKRGSVVKYKDLQPGDIVFFDHKSGSYSGHHPNHVGIYIGNGNMVAAANPHRGTAISSVLGEKDYVGARRFIPSGTGPKTRVSSGSGNGGGNRVAVNHNPVTPVVLPTWVGALAAKYNIRPHFGWSAYN